MNNPIADSTSVDPYADWDAAYVLGALAVTERREYEDHLADCPACRSAITELAAMPGLLAQVPFADAIALTEPGQRVPEPPAAEARSNRVDLLPTRRREPPAVRRGRRTFLLAVAAVVLAVVGGGTIGYLVRGGPQPLPAHRVAFSAVQPSEMTAVADIETESTGTAFTIECQYATSGPYGGAPGREYAVFVVDDKGQAVQAQRWRATPGTLMHVHGSSQLSQQQIAALEIRSVDSGETLLRAPVS